MPAARSSLYLCSCEYVMISFWCCEMTATSSSSFRLCRRVSSPNVRFSNVGFEGPRMTERRCSCLAVELWLGGWFGFGGIVDKGNEEVGYGYGKDLSGNEGALECLNPQPKSCDVGWQVDFKYSINFDSCSGKENNQIAQDSHMLEQRRVTD